jgi:hypothetical protein
MKVGPYSDALLVGGAEFWHGLNQVGVIGCFQGCVTALWQPASESIEWKLGMGCVRPTIAYSRGSDSGQKLSVWYALTVEFTTF